MNTRMERYNLESEEETPSRVRKNTSLYQDIKSNEISNIRNDSNVRVIESNGKTIDIDKIRRYIEENNNVSHRVRKSVATFNEESAPVKEETTTPKDYDLLSVLDKAKKSREVNYESERYRKLNIKKPYILVGLYSL